MFLGHGRAKGLNGQPAWQLHAMYTPFLAGDMHSTRNVLCRRHIRQHWVLQLHGMALGSADTCWLGAVVYHEAFLQPWQEDRQFLLIIMHGVKWCIPYRSCRPPDAQAPP